MIVQKENKYIKIFGRIIFFVFLLAAFSRIVFREEYTRENHNYVLGTLLFLAIAHFVLKLIYNKEQTIYETKSRSVDVKSGLKSIWPQLLIIGLMVLLWFFYKDQNL